MDSYLTKDLAMFWTEAAEWDYLTSVALINWLDPHNIKNNDDLDLFDVSLKNTDISLSHYFSDTEVMFIKAGKKSPIEWLRVFGKCRLSISQNLLAALLNHFGDCPELTFYGHYNKDQAIKEDYPEPYNKNKSKELTILNEASLNFWSLADSDDKATQPINDTVIKWLIDKGFSKISAQQGASIIRPEWAAQGRRSTD